MNVRSLIAKLERLADEHGDVPVYLIHRGGNVLAAAKVSYDSYDEDEGVVVEIIAEGEQ